MDPVNAMNKEQYCNYNLNFNGIDLGMTHGKVSCSFNCKEDAEQVYDLDGNEVSLPINSAVFAALTLKVTAIKDCFQLLETSAVISELTLTPVSPERGLRLKFLHAKLQLPFEFVPSPDEKHYINLNFICLPDNASGKICDFA